MARVNKKRKYYETLWTYFPEVVNIYQLQQMLGGIPEATAYRILKSGELPHLRTWEQIIVPKKWVIDYVMSDAYAARKETLKYKV